MKYCSKCGQEIPENAKFCSHCGEVVQAVNTSQESTSYYEVPAQATVQAKTYSREDEQRELDMLSRRLGWERKAWKITGIVYIVFTVFFVVFGIVMAAFGGFVVADNASYDYSFEDDYYNDYYDDYYSDDYYYYENNFDGEDFAGVFALSYGVTYGVMGVLFLLPVAIVNLVMASKVKKYKEKLYTDCTDGHNHATSVGTIVLGAIFNNIALIFVIVNFILTKNNKELFDSIKANQSAYNNRQL